MYLDVSVQETTRAVRVLERRQRGGGEQERPALQARGHSFPSASPALVRGTHGELWMAFIIGGRALGVKQRRNWGTELTIWRLRV